MKCYNKFIKEEYKNKMINRILCTILIISGSLVFVGCGTKKSTKSDNITDKTEKEDNEVETDSKNSEKKACEKKDKTIYSWNSTTAKCEVNQSALNAKLCRDNGGSWSNGVCQKNEVKENEEVQALMEPSDDSVKIVPTDVDSKIVDYEVGDTVLPQNNMNQFIIPVRNLTKQTRCQIMAVSKFNLLMGGNSDKRPILVSGSVMEYLGPMRDDGISIPSQISHKTSCIKSGEIGYLLGNMSTGSDEKQPLKIEKIQDDGGYGNDNLVPSFSMGELKINMGQVLLSIANGLPKRAYANKIEYILFNNRNNPVYWGTFSSFNGNEFALGVGMSTMLYDSFSNYGLKNIERAEAFVGYLK